ncbi:MAG: hypothetical protein ACKVP7_19820 [Hyphomicrobiaceae bacterium]
MSWTQDLPPAAVTAVKSETAGEIVKWAGKPNPRRAFLQGTAAWLMGIPWCALMFTIFTVLVLAVFSGKPPKGGVTLMMGLMMAGALVFVSAFVMVGIGMMAVPFWAWWNARRTVYAITDRRILKMTYGRTSVVTSIAPDRIVRQTRTERRDGSGTLSLVTGYEKDSDGDVSAKTEELFAVPRVREAERLIDAMRPRAA